ncbi:hypothetical protein [Ligilactobacillus equi]|uniref:hypothetical protein n=1 Tax=Ligilactobacillus equi TaxID=137357 RepID=UPI000468E63D|nr:hypothetical protein [Ligilactobacillus equi]
MNIINQTGHMLTVIDENGDIWGDFTSAKRVIVLDLEGKLESYDGRILCINRDTTTPDKRITVTKDGVFKE